MEVQSSDLAALAIPRNGPLSARSSMEIPLPIREFSLNVAEARQPAIAR